MATRSELRTRLQRRLGLGVVSLVEREKLNDALNAGLSRAISDGVPGLATFTFTGGVLGQLNLTSVTVVKNSATPTVVGANLLTEKVMPRDILVVYTAAGSTYKYLIEDVGSTSLQLKIGIPSNQAISGIVGSHIIRRSLCLPNTGQVVRVCPVDSSGGDLTREPYAALREPFKTGTPRFFDQHYSEAGETSCISLWPAPTDLDKQWTVVQSSAKSRLTLDTDELDYPEEALDAVLERARMAYLTWNSGGAPGLSAANMAVRDTSDNLKNSSNPKQIFYKT